MAKHKQILTCDDDGAEHRKVEFCRPEDEGFRYEVTEGEKICEERHVVYTSAREQCQQTSALL